MYVQNDALRKPNLEPVPLLGPSASARSKSSSGPFAVTCCTETGSMLYQRRTHAVRAGARTPGGARGARRATCNNVLRRSRDAVRAAPNQVWRELEAPRIHIFFVSGIGGHLGGELLQHVERVTNGRA